MHLFAVGSGGVQDVLFHEGTAECSETRPVRDCEFLESTCGLGCPEFRHFELGGQDDHGLHFAVRVRARCNGDFLHFGGCFWKVYVEKVGRCGPNLGKVGFFEVRSSFLGRTHLLIFLM